MTGTTVQLNSQFQIFARPVCLGFISPDLIAVEILWKLLDAEERDVILLMR
jgi:hypothetical protein